MFFFALALAMSYEEPESYNVFLPGDYGSKYYRIPGILRAKDNSLITVTDARWDASHDLPGHITVHIRRSTDSGKTWSAPVEIPGQTSKNGYGDASLVMDKNSGTIFCLMNGDNGFYQSTSDKPMRLYYSKSTDNGVTWSEVVEFTQFIYSKLCTNCDEEHKNWRGMFMTSGNSLQLRSGRIMVAAVVQKKGGAGLQNYAIYTDDLGATWAISPERAMDGADEAKFVELNNGSVLISSRHRGFRKFAVSNDGGLHWGNSVDKKEIIEPACDGDIIRYTSTKDGYNKNRLLHTIPYHPTNRANVSVLISYDEGETWPVKKSITTGGGAYSSITFTEDGTIYVYWEKDGHSLYDLVCTKLSLDWLTDGADHFELPKN